MKRSRFGQPAWASEEERMLADEWVRSKSELSITEFIWNNASRRLRAEYRRQEKACAGMRFGREEEPNGDIVMYN